MNSSDDTTKAQAVRSLVANETSDPLGTLACADLSKCVERNVAFCTKGPRNKSTTGSGASASAKSELGVKTLSPWVAMNLLAPAPLPKTA